MSVKAFFKRHWFGFLGMFIAFGIGYYFYQLSRENREPVFLVDPVRTRIVDSENFAETPLRVTLLDAIKGQYYEIKGDVTSVRFYFWNDGRKSIRPENILEPIIVSLDDENGDILDVRILKMSRKVINPVILPWSPTDIFVTDHLPSTWPTREMNLSFDILERDDGITCQVIYAGNPNAIFSISGTIEGAKNILTKHSLASKRFWKKYPKYVVLFFILIVVFLLGGAYMSHQHSREKKDKLTSEVGKKPSGFGLVLYVLYSITFFIFVVSVLVIAPIVVAKRAASQNITSEVPKEIIP